MMDSQYPGFDAFSASFRLPALGLDSGTAKEGEGYADSGTPGSFMQSPFWASFKVSTGWKAYRFDLEDRDSDHYPLVVLVRPLALGLCFAYVPHGPVLPTPGTDKGQYLEKLAQAILARIKDKILFIRFDLDWELDAELRESELFSSGKRLKKGAPVQVPDTVLQNLQPDEAGILAAMKPKWRYNIKLAEKRGVRVTRHGAEALPIFYALYRETAVRDGISIHPLAYYEKLFAAADQASRQAVKPELSVWVARHESQALAAIITLHYDKTATYLYGASSGEKRNFMPAYALQWAAMQAAKASGCMKYDFFGIPPTGEPGHPMAGLYLFKTGFGGSIIHRAGAVDYPAKPLLFGLFRTLEGLRLLWHKKIRKALRQASS